MVAMDYQRHLGTAWVLAVAVQVRLVTTLELMIIQPITGVTVVRERKILLLA
jgi:hypothetical protein